MPHKLKFRTILIGLLMMVAPAYGQATFGSVLGTVLDATGGVVPGASVQVTNQATGISRTTATDSRGNYEIPNLVPGAYTLVIEAKGFKKYENRGIDVGALRALRVDARLEVGPVESVVTVSSDAPAIETESATVSSVRTTQHLQDMPLNLRSLQGNIGDSGSWAYVNVTPTGSGRGVTMSLGGSRASMMDVNVDGISTRSPQFGNLTPTDPSLDAVQEVRFEYVNNKAEFAEMANISLITRSGGNDLHGRLVWDLGNAALNARSFFAVTNPKANRNDFSANLSGPIKKNKMFFLGGFEGQRLRQAATVSPSLPTLLMRQGDFSELLALRPAVVVRDPFSGAPFANNRIPQNMLYAGSVKYQDKFYPAPNFGPPENFVANFRQEFVQKLRQDHADARVDYYFSPVNMLYARFTYQRSAPGILEGGLPPDRVGYRNQVRNNRNVAVSDTWTIRPTVINEFKIGYARDFNPREGPLDGQAVVDLLGIKGLPPQVTTYRNLPGVSISGLTAVSQIAGSGPAMDVLQITDQISWIRGRHTLKAGADFVPQHSNTLPAPNYGSYSFTNRFTGFAYSDFLVGLPNSTSRSFAPQPVTSYYHYLNGFVQDDFKVSSRLTLSYGVRYEYNKPPTDRFDLIYNFNQVSGGLVVPNQQALSRTLPIYPKEIPIVTASQAGYPERSLRRSDRNNFRPRFGFAWRLGRSNRSVIRGGYGVFNDSLTAQHFGRFYGGPYSGSESFTNSITGGVPLLTLERPFLDKGAPSVTAGNVTVNGTAPDLHNAYAQQWSLTLEREFAARIGARLSYIGTKSAQLLYSRNVNQLKASTLAYDVNRRPYPAYRSIAMLENGGSHTYHALSLEVERKWNRGLYFQGAWTWQKSLTDVDEWAGAAETGLQIEDAYDRIRERGNTGYLPRHRFFTNLIWQLPAGHGRRYVNRTGVLDWVLGGWQLSTTFMTQTGQYFTPSFSGPDPSNTQAFGGRPDRVGDGNLPVAQRNIDRWFDASAFVVPPNGRFGNAGKGILIGPGRQTMNAGLFKDFRPAERITVRAQGSFTNLFNRANFGGPNTNISQPAAAGTIRSIDSTDYSLSDRRVGLVGLRVEF